MRAQASNRIWPAFMSTEADTKRTGELSPGIASDAFAARITRPDARTIAVARKGDRTLPGARCNCSGPGWALAEDLRGAGLNFGNCQLPVASETAKLLSIAYRPRFRGLTIAIRTVAGARVILFLLTAHRRSNSTGSASGNATSVLHARRPSRPFSLE